MAVVMNIVTNVITLVFWLFTRYCERRYSGTHDPATGEKLTEKNDHFSVDKMFRVRLNFMDGLSTEPCYLSSFLGHFIVS